MSAEAAVKPNTGTKLVIRNIGLLLSGDLEKPILAADTVVVKEGRISGIGKKKNWIARVRRGLLTPMERRWCPA